MEVFFVNEKSNAVMPANVVDKGGRAAPEQTANHLHLGISALDGRPPGSAEKSQLKADA